MTLSVVIVNYNVKYFLEQCLISVFNAATDIAIEVYVVDNASADGSCQMVRDRFPSVKLIENTENYGFSYANNQALRLARGEFVLILNPDTVVEESTFSKCIEFMSKHPEAGSLSVKMIDGKGKFLPESKRALPSPSVSFYKIFGFSRLFPKSKTFARYHLGHLSPDDVNEIEILPGAFMFIRKTALDKAGLFDESFFMYGEDIDLSYRIMKSGFKNYYFPKTTIIHYKGESTKKGSINYVLVFYKAMMIFARKHFSQKNAFLYIALIYMAIYFRAGLSIAKRIFNQLVLPIFDAAAVATGLLVIIPFWERVRFSAPDVYPNHLVMLLSTFYIVTWIVSIWFAGGYDKPNKIAASAKGVGIGSVLILIAYALLPEDMRFSRAIVLLISLWAIILIPLIHLMVGLIRGNLNHTLKREKRIVVVGTPSEANRIKEIINSNSVGWRLVGEVSPKSNSNNTNQLGAMNQLSEIVRVNSIDEIVFCASDLSSQEIIKSMLSLVSLGVDFKIAPPDSLSVIGSNSIDTSGDLYTVELSAITQPANRRMKRVLDLLVAILTIILAPLHLPFSRTTRKMFRLAGLVIVGKYTWVGFTHGAQTKGLPQIKPSVFAPVHTSSLEKLDAELIEKINIQYAKSYSVTKDISIIWKNIINKKHTTR
ncbi:glycosyltransferase [Perlabentimonas gracilis]|uniref:glycosyltransferase n=1 Tax=Perlabentimonas gracilis TaxID=2715279 RepID=UPI0014077963|nr:glycosyltransferase [Perlabentimonas gracilis]NHB67499.1 glycosyltransferase [Perlabentimonas gracilis]